MFLWSGNWTRRWVKGVLSDRFVWPRIQGQGEEVHCKLGKTWRDLFKKQGEEWKGECRKKGKRYTVTEAKLWEIFLRSMGKKERKGECRKKGKRYTVTYAKLGEICWRSKGKKERVSAGRRGSRCIRYNFTVIGVSRLGDVDSGKITDWIGDHSANDIIVLSLLGCPH